MLHGLGATLVMPDVTCPRGYVVQTMPNSTSIMDAYAEEGNSLQRSKRMVGEALQSGEASLASLVNQRSSLKVGTVQGPPDVLSRSVAGVQRCTKQHGLLVMYRGACCGVCEV